MEWNENKHRRFFNHPGRVITASFFLVILVGALLLMMPFSSREGVFSPFINCLFTATSATCVTGLVVYDTFTYWTPLGQGIILALIQIGGLGLVTFTTFFNLAAGRKLGLRDMYLAQESGSLDSLADVNALIRFVVQVSLIIELCGAVLLTFTFVPQFGLVHGASISVFLAISAYCNAGFDIMGFQGPYISLCRYADNPGVLLVILSLIVLGGIGFLVIYDIIKYRKRKTLTLHTRIVLIMTTLLIGIGFISFSLLEWRNPMTLGALPVWQRPINALFQSVTLRTAGFNSIDIPHLLAPTKFICCVLMFIGAAPGSTGGGIKLTTVAVLLMTVQSVIRGRDETIILHRRVNSKSVYKAMAVFTIGIAMVGACTAAIYFHLGRQFHNISGLDVLFDEVSAFATVGLSAGVTAQADWLAKVLLVLSMFMGRVGPVSLALSLALRDDVNKNEVIPDGKIMVG